MGCDGASLLAVSSHPGCRSSVRASGDTAMVVLASLCRAKATPASEAIASSRASVVATTGTGVGETHEGMGVVEHLMKVPLEAGESGGDGGLVVEDKQLNSVPVHRRLAEVHAQVEILLERLEPGGGP